MDAFKALKRLLAANEAEGDYYRTHEPPYDADMIAALMIEIVLAEEEAREAIKKAERR